MSVHTGSSPRGGLVLTSAHVAERSMADDARGEEKSLLRETASYEFSARVAEVFAVGTETTWRVTLDGNG